MKKRRLLTLLALLMTAATGAWAGWTGGTYTATATENLGAITVNGDATLTINSNVTVTVNGGIAIAIGKTLTVKGPGTLVVSGTNGNNGNSDGNFGDPGGDGVAAVIGTIVVQDGANVMATGGKGGDGGYGEMLTGGGGPGGAAFSGAVTIYDGTISASGGNGGTWGGGDGADGGSGGYAFIGTLTYYGGSVTATGGNGGGGIDGDADPGKAFANANSVSFQTNGYILTSNGSAIQTIGGQKQITIAPAPVAVTGVTLPATATVTLGDAVALTATVAPADATDKKVKWTVTAGTDKVKLYKDADCKTEVGTDATDVLTVYAKGLAAGDATVKVESNEDETKTATCAVTAKHGTYKVAMKAGVTDGDQWTARAGGSGDFAAMPLKGVEGGTKPVELKYGGDLEVKRVTMRVVPTCDLSMVDCAGTARTDGQWTANCYMVHTAGDYKLPLVYGNAIKAGQTNDAAYTGVENANTTLTFPRHDGNAITAPWIKDNGITVASAELLWQDADGLITEVGISGDYLTLTVGKDAATQEGNALVAAKDADGTIVWSWHIWVTKQTFATLTTITASGYGYKVTPVNLGWVGDATSATGGYNTYYQWGRKDAFIPSNPIPSTGTNNTNHTVYNINNNDVTTTAFTHTYDNSVTIGGNIQHPTVHNNSSTKGPCNTTYYNMWDAQQTSTDIAAAATVKTVYDPCPPGFCVPTIGLYNYINSQNRPTWNTGYTYPATNGVFFPASGDRGGSSGSLGSVGTYGNYWSATLDADTNVRGFYFYSSGWGLSNYSRATGCPVRAVAE